MLLYLFESQHNDGNIRYKRIMKMFFPIFVSFSPVAIIYSLSTYEAFGPLQANGKTDRGV